MSINKCGTKINIKSKHFYFSFFFLTNNKLIYRNLISLIFQSILKCLFSIMSFIQRVVIRWYDVCTIFVWNWKKKIRMLFILYNIENVVHCYHYRKNWKWLLLCPESPQDCFGHVGIFYGHVRILPNNRKTKSGKNRSSHPHPQSNFKKIALAPYDFALNFYLNKNQY